VLSSQGRRKPGGGTRRHEAAKNGGQARIVTIKALSAITMNCPRQERQGAWGETTDNKEFIGPNIFPYGPPKGITC